MSRPATHPTRSPTSLPLPHPSPGALPHVAPSPPPIPWRRQAFYDNVDMDPVVKLTQQFDGLNSVSSAVSLKTKAKSYGWTRRLAQGGTLDTTLHVHDKVGLGKCSCRGPDRG